MMSIVYFYNTIKALCRKLNIEAVYCPEERYREGRKCAINGAINCKYLTVQHQLHSLNIAFYYYF